MFSLDTYWTLRKSAAVVRRSDRGVVAVTGGDRASWLQGLLTNDVVALKPGERCYSAYLTPQGRMITDMNVVAMSDRMLLDVPASLAAALTERLDGLIFAEDAQVKDVSAETVVWGAYGPLVDTTIDAGFEDSSFGLPGVAIYLGAADSLPPALAALPVATLETLDVLRIEAGTPRFLVDMTEDTIPLEAGIESRAISFTKGCYVGQEVIIRVTHRGGGRVAKRLVGWKDSSSEVAAHATIVANDREIGRVTSTAFSPIENARIGLGYVHRDFAASGTAITIVSGGERIEATTRSISREDQ